MTVSIFRISALCLSLIIGVGVVGAQTTEFAHQGSLPTSASPTTGSFEMEVRLFDAAAGGSQVGSTLTVANVAVTDLKFNIKLDFGATAFPGADRFLEFRFRKQGSAAPFTVVSPRDKVVSVPYAIRALEASRVGGFDPSGFVQNRTTTQPSANFNISGTGTANALNAATVSATNVNATQYNIGGEAILRRPQFNSVVAGRFAGAAFTSAVENSFYGAFSGNDTTSGSRNSYFGFFSGSFNVTGNDNSAFGESAGAQAIGNGNSFFGTGAGGNTRSTGNNNTFIGIDADFVVTQNVPSGNNTLLGANAKVDQVFNAANIQFATAIGAGAVVTESDTIVIGKFVGVHDGTSRPSDRVQTAGLFKPGALDGFTSTPVCRSGDGYLANCSSSLRYKTDINPYLGGLDVVRKLRPISFAWKENGKQELGFGAEEVFKIEPRLTFRNDRNEIEGVLYAQVTTALVNAVKEQQEQIETLTKQIDALKKLVCIGNKDADACRK